MGQPDPARYSLPHQFDECMKKFFGYARGQGIKTVSLARISDTIPMYDAFHFRENSAHRKKLTEHIGHHMTPRCGHGDNVGSMLPASGAVILAVYRDLKGAFKGDIDIDVEVDVDMDSYFGRLKRVSKSVQVLFNGMETFLVLTSIFLK